MAKMPEASVDCCVTSPPYWGLRDYGTGKWEGGDPACSHSFRSGAQRADGGLIEAGCRSRDGVAGLTRSSCKCGAVRVDGQLGLESTPEEYVAAMVAVFREVRRVLREDGTLWLNLGDSYNAAGREGHGTRLGLKQQTNRASADGSDANRPSCESLKPKDIVGIPWRVAFALQADGWYLRQDIIWAKPNPMPESVRDRCTKAHEYLFLLAKAERYFYDAAAIAEPVVKGDAGSTFTTGKTAQHQLLRTQSEESRAQRRKTGGNFSREYAESQPGHGAMALERPDYDSRNRRSVWTIPTHPFPEAHFATFPEKLVEPCILAGSREGGTVLDPFSGAGTTGVVAIKASRHYVGCELNPEYVEMSRRRLANVAPLLAKETP